MSTVFCLVGIANLQFWSAVHKERLEFEDEGH
jgi:hypothetical protein